MKAVVTFYRFCSLRELEALRGLLLKEAADRDLKGTILLASEGINGTLSGTEADLVGFAEFLSRVRGLGGMPFRYSTANGGNPVFYRLKVRIKAEIVALGQPEADPSVRTGIPVDAKVWNELLEDPEVIVIDTRNDYEIAIGSFPGALPPGTMSFKQFPSFVATMDPEAQPRVAMFCTGGIRCEKASAYMLSQGFETVFQLRGGILRYLETVEPDDNRWRGECFVFDQRVSVDGSLAEGSYEQCFACRSPLTPAERESADYRPGISCPHCVGQRDPERTAALEERQRQVALAADRNDQHVGKKMPQKAQRLSKGSR